MHGRGAIQGRNLAVDVLRRLLVVAFAFRAIIPAGFMPDLVALGQERIEIVICTGTGPQIIEVDGNGQPVEPTSPGGVSVECLFATSLATAVLSPTVGEGEIARLEHGQLSFGSDETVLRVAIQGAPLGSRAPPYLLA